MTTHQAETVQHALREEREEPCDETWWMPGPNSFAACALSPSARTVAEARRFTRTTLEGWQMCAGVAEDAATVVSELVTNALRYGTTDGALDAAGPAWLALTRQDATVLCAVSDPGTSAPVVQVHDELAESGRGLHIVDVLSDAWGWTPPDRLGKTVWATVSMRG
ncbi:ATP-binding protein [Streptomyces sp. NPDC048483]|uniref:ATP-binding protein n=1 Tax=Streptomyces sp. NPDC048483 TaxID=3154927 RepID=UPI00343AC7B9